MEPTSQAPSLRTDRLTLRRWRSADREPFAVINAHPQVTRFLHGPLTRSESDALVDRIEAHFDQHGFGLWAVDIPGVATCAGFIGLAVPTFDAHFTPAVEVGWRFHPAVWGHGYATEGARLAIDIGFGQAGLDEIVSFTAVDNVASRRVMGRLGMSRDPADDFDHPNLAPDHPLRRHVLYRRRCP
jgi:RimJ/RimL family protein N-acetyltransferase